MSARCVFRGKEDILKVTFIRLNQWQGTMLKSHGKAVVDKAHTEFHPWIEFVHQPEKTEKDRSASLQN